VKRLALAPALCLALCLCLPATGVFAQAVPTATPQATAADRAFQAIYQAEWAWRMQQASGGEEDGDPNATTHNTHLPDVGPQAQAAKLAYLQGVLKQLDGVDVQALSPAEQVNYAIYRPQIEHAAASLRFRDYEMPFNSDSAFWSNLDFMARADLREAAAYHAYAARLRDVPRYFDQQIANMRAGLARGFSVPRAVLAGRDGAIAMTAELQDPEAASLWAPYKTLPGTIPAAEQETLRTEGRAAIRDAVIPAFARLLAFYRNEYMPKARTTLAAEAMPDGKAWYREQIRTYTTLDLSPDDIHAIGLREVASIRAEMDAIIDGLGFEGTSKENRFSDFLHFLRTDPQFYARTPQELLNDAAWISKQVDGQVGRIIGTLPRGRFTIVPVPASIAPFWTAGRGGAGTYWVNTYDLPSRPLYNLPALTLHESSPGHALQQSLVLEQGALPGFRKDYISAYGEGWGLYSEWLGKEMGIYRTPYEDFGRLTYAMWRACRLVIDTGIHAKRWSREKATDYMVSVTGYPRTRAQREVERYCVSPGQACSYKVGHTVWTRLRAESKAKLGPKFDLKAWHDAALLSGSMPLTVLERRLAEWTAAQA